MTSPAIAQESSWKNLFDGQSLTGWSKLNGEATYLIENETIIGITTLNTPNTFLATDEKYGDFILELETWVDPSINSGIQIRSQSNKEYRNGRVHGYQFELDPSERKWSGGIYDEARRGWIYPLTRNKKGQHAFKNGQWNTIRIEAIGPEINTWINGVQCARLVDDMDASGFIALQVHSIGRKDQAGKRIMWKNIRITTENLENERMRPDPAVPAFSYLHNTLTEDEKRKGWRLLWDGQSTAGWRSARSETFPSSGWQMDDGVLTVLESGGGESTAGGDIITSDKFSNFELILDFKLTQGANSGIKYFVDPELNKGPGSSIGLEYQLLDDFAHPDAKNGVNGNRTLASLYDLIRADNLSESNRDMKRYFNGQWNRARIVVKGGDVEHWLNNVKVVEFNRHSQIYKALVEKSKYVVWPKFGQLPSGHILLQDHGNTVHFKNIKIREF